MRRSGAGVEGLHPDLAMRLRRPDPTAELITEARITNRADVRQRQDQWTAADGWPVANLTVLPEGIVQLSDTTSTLIQQTSHPSNLTDLDNALPSFAAMIEWAGAEPAEITIKRVKCWLVPRVNGAAKREVAKWRLRLYRVSDVMPLLGATPKRQLILQEIADPLTVDVTGDAAGEVLFDYSAAASVDRPKPKRQPPILHDSILGTLFNTGPVPTTYLVVYALKADGSSAGNVGWGYDSTVASVVTGGNILSGRKLEAAQPIIGSLFPGGTHQDGGVIPGTPHIVIEMGTYTSATITFSGAGNRIDLGGVPTNDVEFSVRGAVPAGCSLVAEVRNDADSAWVVFTDGQLSTALAGVGKNQTYKIRCTLNTNGGGNLTPALTHLAVREITTVDLADVADPVLVSWGVDPVECKGEIAELHLRAVRDGRRDFHAAIEDLLGTYNLVQLELRLWVGDRALTRDKWLHLDDFIADNTAPRAADVELVGLSPLVLVRDLVPPYSPGTPYAPDGDAANPGTWTTDAGGSSNLYQRIDEQPDPDETDFIQSPLDPAAAKVSFTLPTPTDTTGRRHIVDYEYRKDTAGGKTIALTIRLKQSSTVIAVRSGGVLADLPSEWTTGNFELTDAEVAAITDYPNLQLEFEAQVSGAGGSRRAQVDWADFRTGGKRAGITYLNQTLKAVFEDLLFNQLALPARYRGPGIEDAVTTVSKTVLQPTSRIYERDNITSKTEVDALLELAGMALTTSQGRVTALDLFGRKNVAAIFPADEVRVLSVTPGYEQRIPEFFVKWGWDGVSQDFRDEVRAFNGPALLALSDTRLDPPKEEDEEVCKWIADEALAKRLAQRKVEAFGLGLLQWEFELAYPHPEIFGDLVALEVDQFVARDPVAARALAGRLWAMGLAFPLDAWGRRFRFFIRSYADILSSNEPADRALSATQMGVSGYVGEAAGDATGDKLTVYWSGSSGVQSVRIATSTVSQPAAGTGALYVGAQGLATVAGPFVFGTPVYVTITPYESWDGSTVAGIAAFVLKTIDGSSISTPYNTQGSTLPTPISSLKAIWDSRGQATGHMWATFRWGVIGTPGSLTMYRPDQSTITIPGSSDTAIIPGFVPSLSQVAGGSLGARTRYVRIGLVKDGIIFYGYNPVSTHDESSLAISANNLLKVASPGAVAGYDGWCPLVGTASGTEVTQPGTISTPIAFGTDWTEPSSGAQTSNTTNTPFDINYWNGAAVFIELTASTSYYLYPYWDPARSIVRFKYATSPDPASSAVQYGDGSYPMTTGSIKIDVPAAAGSSTGQPPGPGASGGNTKIFT